MMEEKILQLLADLTTDERDVKNNVGGLKSDVGSLKMEMDILRKEMNERFREIEQRLNDQKEIELEFSALKVRLFDLETKMNRTH